MDGNAGLVRRGRLDTITGMRFVAALVVFLCHAATFNFVAPDTGVGEAFHFATESAGTAGVTFFFILSGFVLTWSARPGETYGGFLRRRMFKMYPNHLVTFALAMALFAAASTPPVSAVLNVLLLHAWRPAPGGGNGPSWSLSCDLLFYLLFPLLLPLVKKIPVARLWWWVGGAIAVIMVLPTVAQLLPSTPRFPDDFDGTMLEGVSMYPFWFLLTFPPVRLLDFVLGILIARIVLSGRWTGPGVAQAVALTAVGYVVGLFVPFYYTLDAVSVIPMSLLIGALAVAESRGRTSWLGSPVFRRLGEVSFAFYLIHEIALLFVRSLVGFDHHLPPFTALLVIAAAFALSLALSFLLYHGVETPVMRKWAGPRRTAPAGGAVPAPAPPGERPDDVGEKARPV
ncbi:acyltransferase family protein [Streptomyces sp. NPDC001922]|uniref:acyltransferase family protein n=1 Tax=Streptomyces sp. NPDC001922 TaxID=3364624 RepID=UPI0036CA5900